MKLARIITIVTAVALTMGAGNANATTAEDVIGRYVEALGGEKAIKSCKTLHAQGTFTQGDLTGKLEVFTGAPDRYRMALTIEGMGEFSEGAIDGVGWSSDPMAGPQLMTGAHLTSTLARNRHNSELYTFDIYDAVTFEGTVEFDGVSCHKLKLAAPWGETFQYFDTETGLLRGSEADQMLAGDSKVRMTLIVREYKEFDGRMYATKSEQLSEMGEQVITITSVTHNKVTAGAFDPPPGVAALMKLD